MVVWMVSRSYWRSDCASSTYVSPTIATELATKTIAYHSARRKPRVWRSRSRHLENIANPPDGVDHLGLEALVDLLAQPEHEHVHDIRSRIEAVIPDVRQDHRLRHHPAGVAHQVFEQRELTCAQLDVVPLPCGTSRHQVERQVANGEMGRGRSAGRPPDEGLDARQQLGKGERLGQVVVAAGFKSLDPVVDGAPCTENQHRRPHLPPSHRRDHTKAIELRQHQVDDGDVVRTSRGELEARFAVRRVIDRETSFAQPSRHELRDGHVVFDDDGTHYSAIRLQLSDFSYQLSAISSDFSFQLPAVDCRLSAV